MKNDVIKLLNEKKYIEILKLSSGKKKSLSTLISLSYDKKNLLAWRAIEAVGVITREIAKSDTEAVGNLTGRLLWTIRDESGGIGWSAPEILGEIVRNNPTICSDIATVLVSFHNEPPLRAGILRAIGRTGKINAEMVDYAIPVALTYLKSSEPDIRGYSAWALGELGASEAVNGIQKLMADTNRIIFYEDGVLKEKTVGEISSEALKKFS